MDVKPSRAEQGLATKKKIMESARRLFAERGYADSAVEEVVREAGVTKGAFYHHFSDKAGLFRSIFDEVDRELVQAVAESAVGAKTTWERLLRGCEGFLDACLDRDVRRIILSDGPVVLGWDAWRAQEMRNCLGLLRGVLSQAMEEGVMARQPVESLAHVLFGALIEAAISVALAPDQAVERAESGAVIRRLLEGMKELAHR
jgi:AcrR family transcriptional regulator